MPDDVNTTTDAVTTGDATTAATATDAADSTTVLGQDSTGTDNVDDFVNPLTTGGTAEPAQDKTKVEAVPYAEVNFDEIVVPEGMSVDTDLINEFKPIAKDLKLSKDQAQKLLDLQFKSISKSHEARQNEFNAVKAELEQETKNMLGKDYKKELSYAARAMNLLDEKDRNALKEMLNVSGAGNHPLLVKMFIAAGKAISEDKFVNGVASNNKDQASILFGDAIKKS